MKRRAQPWLGTLTEVGIADEFDDAALNQCFNQTFATIAAVHRLMSFHDPDSDVSRINRAPAGASVEIDSATWTVLQTALSLGQTSSGMFDIGCAATLVKWEYLPALPGAAPAPVAAHDALHLAHASRVEKNHPMWIDLGGIAKGYAVDAAVAALARQGVRTGYVNAGGDLRVFGDIDFPVAVRDPASPTEAGTRQSLRNEAMATSANYFSRKRIGHRVCSALVDGRNGRPITASISASVRAPSCMIADALTKVVLASGDAAHPVLRSFGATAFII
jgi:FAD:protein FMN transferase